ncbi:unnamed protein product [Lactuca virosa]|uniref:RPW8 domain-containing protein n=1 Tax=Lactuca virosa TaxID=75947 RepID=A0AAU9NGI5_9ASTR|nr:unnamed protein product [Lactuca virosa]
MAKNGETVETKRVGETVEFGDPVMEATGTDIPQIQKHVFEAPLQLVLGELQKALYVVGQIIQTPRFKSLLKRLEKTLKSIEQVFYESWRLSKVLDHPDKETIKFISYLRNAIEIVVKCSSINCQTMSKKVLHSNKLMRLNNELLRFFQIDVQEKTMNTSMTDSIAISGLEDNSVVAFSADGYSRVCNLVHLQNLSITNCHELDVLPKKLGNLSNLEILNLHCCTKLQEIPESIGSLHNLSFLDLSDCLSISLLPDEIGELCSLRVVKMSGVHGLQELPDSMSKLSQLEEVICDEETSYLWMDFESDLYNLKLNVVEDDRFESFMKIVQ